MRGHLSIPIRGRLINRCHPLARDLVLCHAVNEGSGEFLFDASGNRHHGDDWNNNPAWDRGPSYIGHALQLGDTDQCHIYCAGAGVLRTDEPFSAAVWARPDVANRTLGYIHSTDFYFNIATSFNWWFRVGGTNIRGDTDCTSGVWYHVAFTYDGAYGRVYVNGILDVTPVSCTGSYTGAYQFRYGATGSSDFEGALGQCGLWNRCLSADETRWLHREPWAMFGPDPVRSRLPSLVRRQYRYMRAMR